MPWLPPGPGNEAPVPPAAAILLLFSPMSRLSARRDARSSARVVHPKTVEAVIIDDEAKDGVIPAAPNIRALVSGNHVNCDSPGKGNCEKDNNCKSNMKDPLFPGKIRGAQEIHRKNGGNHDKCLDHLDIEPDTDEDDRCKQPGKRPFPGGLEDRPNRKEENKDRAGYPSSRSGRPPQRSGSRQGRGPQ